MSFDIFHIFKKWPGEILREGDQNSMCWAWVSSAKSLGTLFTQGCVSWSRGPRRWRRPCLQRSRGSAHGGRTPAASTAWPSPDQGHTGPPAHPHRSIMFMPGPLQHWPGFPFLCAYPQSNPLSLPGSEAASLNKYEIWHEHRMLIILLF